jgi:fibronectin-binding autotransporter adhesin
VCIRLIKLEKTMKKLVLASLVSVGVCLSVLALQTAGTLSVDLDVGDLIANEGDKIASWTNNGALGSVFTNATAGEGAVFRTNVAGAAAVEFTGNVNTVMRSDFGVPEELTTNNSWSVEVWVHNPAENSTPENFVSWTPRGDSDDADTTPNYELMELRWYNNANTLEHYAHNVNWGVRGRPAAGAWHHLVYTRDKATNIERVYKDGALYGEATLNLTRIRPDGMFVLGATQNGAKTGFEYFFSGYLGKVRIHTGTLSAVQVVQNYEEERAEYGVSATPDPVWQGAAGTPLDWNDPANWVGGYVAGGGSYVIIENGGIPVLTNSLGSALNDITSGNGGLVISNNATLSIAGDTDQLGAGSGNTYSLTVASGRLAFTGANTHSLNFGVNGATATAVIGVDGPAELEIDWDMIIGQSGGTGVVTVATGGSLICLNGWQYIGLNAGGYGKVTVDGGFFGSTVNTLNIRVAENGAAGELILNSGTVACNGDLMLAAGNSTVNTDALVALNGGLTHVRRLFAEDAIGSAVLHLNGGTIRNRDSRGDFLFNLDAALMQSGGVTFDVIAGTEITVNQPLLEDDGSTGGGITKTGDGILNLGGTNTFTGDITVNAGGLVFNVADGIVAGYSGAVILNDATAGVGYNKAGGVDELLALIETNSVGKIIVLPANAADDIDFSEYPNLTLAFADGVDYTGTFTPYGDTYSFYPVGTGTLFAQSVAGASNFEVYGGIGDQIEFTGDSSFSGGTLIDGCELIMSHSNALGTGSITLTNSAVLRLNAGNLSATFAQRITPESKGFIMLTAASAGVNLDLAGIPGVQVGTFLASLTYTGAITPASGTYRFTGGGQQMRVSGNTGLQVSNLGGASAVEVVNGNDERTFVNGAYTGGITLGGGNTYTGGTVITNRGLVRVNSDAFGAVPAMVDPDNIYVDNGCIRLGSANITFDDKRGVTVGPGGLEVHPWSGHTFNFNGPLSGSGDIFSTDGGTVYFGGTNNTWSGDLRINSGRTLGIGFGDRFSWNNSAPIVGLGGAFALRYDGDLTWSSEFDNPLGTDGASLEFRKQGSGTLTVDVDPLYTGNTLVQGGTLVVASADAIPGGTGRGDLNISGGAAVDVNGYNIEVNGLDGAGDVTDSDGGASTFTVGVDNSGGSFSGTIEPGQLIKNGSGTQTLAAGAEA